MTQVDQGQQFDATNAANSLGGLLQAMQTLGAPSSVGGPGLTSFGDQTAAPTTTTDSTTAPTSSGSVDPVPAGTKISQGYHGDTGGQTGVDPGTDHPGVDLAVPVGTKIVSAISGKVTHAANDDPSGYGRWVEITGADGTVTRYGHLSGMNVTEGETVSAGQQIGLSGGAPGADGSGNADGPHLHFEVRKGGQTVDPIPYLAGGQQILGTVPEGATASIPAQPLSPQAGVDTAVKDLVASASGQTPTDTNPQGTPSTTSGSTSGSDTDPKAIDAFLNAIKQHESGGDYTIRNQSGLSNASGAYQFLGSTWGGYGGYQDAASAPPAVQDAKAHEMAQQLFDQFHSWRLAAIAWYGGPGVAEQVAGGQNPGSPQGQGSYLAYGDTIAGMMSGGK